MPNSKQIVYLSQAQYQELITNGTITVDGVTVTYNENDIYVTPQAEPVTDVRVNGTSISSGGVANVPLASADNAGAVVVRTYSDGLYMSDGKLTISGASENLIKNGGEYFRPIVPYRQHISTFYGLAKAAGADMKDIANATVGIYPDAQKAAIQNMLGISNLLAPTETTVASKAYNIGETFTSNGKLYKATTAISLGDTIITQDAGATVSEHNAEETKISEYAVRDIQINGTSITQNGVANIDKASASTLGVIMVGSGLSIGVTGVLRPNGGSANDRKAGTNLYIPVVMATQHESTFYGLAKAAGDTTQTASNNAVGTYTDAAKSAIQNMLGVSDLISTKESSIATAAHTINSLFLMDGKLHKATDTIGIGDAVTAGTNCQVVKADEVFVKNTDYATNITAGIIKVNPQYGVIMGQDATAAYLFTYPATSAHIKSAASNNNPTTYCPITPIRQHEAVFFGLSKVAGVDLANETVTLGTYPDTSKAAIKSMLGIVDGSTGTVTVSGTTPTITAVENTRYVCGEVATLTITPPASGICIIRFTSGTTATVLTATGVVWPEWFDDTALEANRVYEICITDGYGAVMSWAQ